MDARSLFEDTTKIMDYYSAVPGAGLSARTRAASITCISHPPVGSSPAPSPSGLAPVDIPADKVASLCHRHRRHAPLSLCAGIDDWQPSTPLTRRHGNFC